MSKRILSILLVIVILVSLASCGGAASKEKKHSLSEAMECLTELQAGKTEVVLEYDMDMGDGSKSKMGVKLECTTSDDKNSKQSLDVSYRIDTKSDYQGLTTILMDDQYIYVDVDKIKESGSDFLKALGTESLPEELTQIDKQYLRIKNNTQNGGIGVLATYLAFFVTSFRGFDEANFTNLKKLFPVTVKTIEETVKDISPKVIEQDGKACTFHFNKKNGKEILEALSKADFSESIDIYLKVVEENTKKMREKFDRQFGDSDLSVIFDAENMKKDMQDELKEGCQVGMVALDGVDALDVTYTIGVEGSKGEYEVDQEISCIYQNKKDSFILSLQISTEEGVYEKIEIPTEYEDYNTIFDIDRDVYDE